MAAIDRSESVGTRDAEIKVGLGLTMESKAESTNKAEDKTVSGVASAGLQITVQPGCGGLVVLEER